MTMNQNTTVRLGDLVKVAFDWAAQCSSDPRDVPLLAAKSVDYLVRRARKTPVSRQTAGPALSEGPRELLVLEGVGRQPGPLITAG